MIAPIDRRRFLGLSGGATELFRAIPAVQAGQVHLVGAALWPGLGHLWARALVDDLERRVVPA